MMLRWRVWQLRNDQTHGKEVPLVLATVDFLNNYYKSIKLAGRYSIEEILKGKMPSSVDHIPVQRKVIPAVSWMAPMPGTIALSVDGSFQEAGGSAAAGMVPRDSGGKVLFPAYRVIFHFNDPLEVELHAIMQGMNLAIQHTALPVVVQSDSSKALSNLSNNAFGAFGIWSFSSRD